MSVLSAGDQAARDIWRAIGLMCASAVLFGIMAVSIRLASAQLHPFEIAFFRNVFGFAFALPLLIRHGPKLLQTSKLPLYFTRCLIGMGSMLAGFWAIVNLPLAQAISISYSTPLFVTILAVLMLGEVVRARRWTAVLIGFAGVMVIMRPFAGDFTAGMLVALFAAAMSAAVAVSIKFLSRTEHPDAIVIYTSLLWIPMSLLPALFVWETPVGITWLWIILAGALGTAGHMCWTRAFRLGDASLLTPVSFLQLPVVAVLAWLLFGEGVDRYTAIGAAIVFGANAYIAHRESQLARRAVTDPEIAPETSNPR
jgi:drug/metabolite transporter (DMT)-like permease